MKENLLRARNVLKSFENASSKITVLDDVDVDIQKGEFLTIMGPSGSGKSTLLYAISGMDTIDSGKITIDDTDINQLNNQEISDFRRKKMGFIFQNATMLKNLNILDNILLPAIKDKQDVASAKNKAYELMELTGIKDLENRDISQVSGGELQRASICRALINEPQIVFGDEPTGALNSKTTKEVIGLLKEINSRGTTLLLVTHDPNVAYVSDRVLFMKDGKIISEEILANLDEEKRQEKVMTKMSELKI